MALPDLILNRAFQEDFDEADAPCFALGLAEIGGQRLGLMALKPDREIPAHVFGKGMAVGHGLLGTAPTVLCRFAFRFYDFACFTALINPANPVMRPILAAMAETGDFLFISLGPDHKATAFRPGPGAFDLAGFRNNLPAMLNATTTDIDYLEWHRTLLRNPDPADGELVTWVCHNNADYLDLTVNTVAASSM